MNITVKGIGDLAVYFGKEPREVELPDHACVRDLLQRIEQYWGTIFPPYFWDYEKHQFRGPVILVINKKAVQDLNTPLQNGVEVRIIRAVAGG
jgi:molybdopterin converting factor small subunit